MPRHNERDQKGWRIPVEGTISRKIYNLMCRGIKMKMIAQQLDHNENSVRVLAHKIKNPETYF